MRFYASKFPEVDELVMVQVKQIQEMGAYVKLVSPRRPHLPALRRAPDLARRPGMSLGVRSSCPRDRMDAWDGS